MLKGALMLQFWSGSPGRSTRDIDLLGRQTLTVDQVVEIIRECIDTVVPDDGLRFDPASVAGEPIRAQAKYAGIRVKFLAFLERARITLQVDVGFGDVVSPAAS